MRIIRLPVMCALLIFGPRGAGAQVTPQIAPLITHNPAHPDLCRTYQNSTPSTLNRPSGFVLAEGEARDIRTCMMDLAAAVKATLDGQTMEAGQTASEEIVHHELLKEYLAYRRLRRWNLVYQDNYIVREGAAGASGGGSRRAYLSEPLRIELNEAFVTLAETLDKGLTTHGLNQPFSAELVSAFSLQQPGAQTAAKKTTAEAATPQAPSTTAGSTSEAAPAESETGTSSKAGAAGLVRWQSIHFYADPDNRFDLDLAGQFGFQPVLALVQPTTDSATPAKTADVLAAYQSAFVWNLAFEPNIRVADLAELTPFVKVGQSILNSTHTVFENGPNTTVAVAAPNDTGRAELATEAGVGLSIYGQSMEILHLKKGLLSPMFYFGAGIRRDNRFSQSGVLADFTRPEGRLFLRFMVDALQLANKDQPDKPFTIGISVDFDSALYRKARRVPSGTRVLLRGDLNLFKATQSEK